MPLSVMHLEKASKSGFAGEADVVAGAAVDGVVVVDVVPESLPDEHAAVPPTSAVAATVSSAARKHLEINVPPTSASWWRRHAEPGGLDGWLAGGSRCLAGACLLGLRPRLFVDARRSGRARGRRRYPVLGQALCVGAVLRRGLGAGRCWCRLGSTSAE
jgi:hypothetical protein